MAKSLFLSLLLMLGCNWLQAQGIIHTIGGGVVGGVDTGDGGLALSAVIHPHNIVLDATGNIYISVTDPKVSEVRKIDVSTGIINVVAGTRARGYAGDNGPATSGKLNCAQGIYVDAHRDLYIADIGNGGSNSDATIRKVSAATGIITTVAGKSGPVGFSGDSGLAINAQLDNPCSIFVDANGDIFIADTHNNRIRKVSAATGIITTIAGTGGSGNNGDNGLAINAEIEYPSAVCGDAAGNIYVVGAGSHTIRKIDHGTGIITTIAGTGVWGYAGDGGPALNADIKPVSLFLDSHNNIFFADGGTAVRKIDAFSGTISTVAGKDTAGFSGDGGISTNAKLSGPSGVCTDGIQNIYIADAGNQRIRKVDNPEGIGQLLNTQWLNLKILPNPSEGRFSLELDKNVNFGSGTGKVSAAVYNMQGIKVYEGLVTGRQTEIDLCSQAPGIYMLYIKAGDEVRVEKLVIK